MLFKSEWGVIEKWRSSSLSNMEKKRNVLAKRFIKERERKWKASKI